MCVTREEGEWIHFVLREESPAYHQAERQEQNRGNVCSLGRLDVPRSVSRISVFVISLSVCFFWMIISDTPAPQNCSDTLMKYLFLWLAPALAECTVVCIIFATYFQYAPLAGRFFFGNKQMNHG